MQLIFFAGLPCLCDFGPGVVRLCVRQVITVALTVCRLQQSSSACIEKDCHPLSTPLPPSADCSYGYLYYILSDLSEVAPQVVEH